MKIVVFGKSGQVATELQRHAGVTAVGRDTVDFANPDAVRAFAESAQADAFINAAAYTAVDKAEEEQDAANAINGSSVTVLAEVAAARGIPLVHISTDYVFDGAGDAPRGTDEPTAPPNAYGRSKLIGEDGIRAAGGTFAVLRTSWVVSAHGNNFVKTMLRLGAERDALTIVADQIGGPTTAAAIADACIDIAKQLIDDPARSGTYHFSGAPDVSWADFAREIFRQADLSCDVTDIPTSAYPTPATRPLNSRLDCSATKATFGIAQPDWRTGLADILTELGARKND
ncbi:dTDP-4-dehydrorhamnose reductase [Actibacterium lipolyticum]|uniref:dTDP-4-dehydrorhamnose reductase n=1 Tax=Actibacterium lipolyticum TaxID=1524263 RepID=A0A238KWH1_9RHOB|nr:dTDP-4-dehydrorhamnose reductase [Actibacterium lipolyticum]SMX46426.1 dTDP-4-dehydrorhamnose reductase [Actibacterium lipolyticum]